MYSPLQFAPEEMAKPDGSLSLPYVAGALRRAGYPVRILDVSVGNEKDSLAQSFLNTTQLPSGLIRCGLPRERIEQEVADADVVGISSIFTTQSSMVFELIGTVKAYDADKLVLAGGVNARNLRDRFYRAGVDIILMSEGEFTVIEIAEFVRGKRELRDVHGIAFLDESGREVITPPPPPLQDMDELPFPAWDLLPLDKYWEISRPHGGQFDPGATIRYAALQSSRGCPFRCTFCHISKEEEGSAAGGIGSFRTKSVDRVLQELQTLKDLGAEYVFFEDDSLLAKKKRAHLLFREAAKMGFKLADVNGVNIVHLLTKENGKLVVDEAFLDVIAEAGFKWFHLPFESGNKRLIEKYSSSKWSIEHTDTADLIRKCESVGIHVAGNYIIGYPDETIDEIYTTVRFAKRHVEEGLNHAAIFALVPFPGTVVYDEVIASGQLDPDFDTDKMKWTKSILKGLAVPAESLEYMRQMAWLTVNRTEFVDYKIGQRVTSPVEG
jgi:radical SAM superfamily enzyme YgiQ (UPF0313 family)